MKKLFIAIGISAAALLGGSAANAADDTVKANAATDVTQSSTDISSRRHYRHYGYRHYRHYGYRHYRPYYRSYGYYAPRRYYGGFYRGVLCGGPLGGGRVLGGRAPYPFSAGAGAEAAGS